MKNLFLLFIAALFIVSCEDLETNDKALQANINNVFYKSDDVIGYRIQNNFAPFRVLEGYSQNQKLTLKYKWYPLNESFSLGGDSPNIGTFEDEFGNIYTTGPNATGVAIVTERTGVNNGRKQTGTFNFTAISASLDTIVVSNGVFFEISTIDEVDDGSSENSGTFSASVDNSSLNPDIINAIETGNSIVVLASNGASSVYIKVPIDVEAGFYDLPENGFVTKYTLDAVDENAITGNVVIVNHNVGAKTLTGTFFFTTENHIIEQGQFNVTYQ